MKNNHLRFRQCLRGILTWFVIIFTRNDFCDESSDVLNPGVRWCDGDQREEPLDKTPSFQSLSCLRKKYFHLIVLFASVPVIPELGTLRWSPVPRVTATAPPASLLSSSARS